MQKFKSHKVVEAFKIATITGPMGDDPSYLLCSENDEDVVKVSSEYIGKHDPQIPGYYIRYPDGYESWSPAGSFEEGYIAVGTNPMQGDIDGYRVLSAEEVTIINAVKTTANMVGALVTAAGEDVDVDQRWLAIAKTDLQKGFMSLVRSVARPSGF